MILALLPVLLPIVALLEARDRRRRRLAAERTACMQCGRLLGQAALNAADAAWAAEMTELHRRYPGHRLRVVRRVWAACTACGAQYDWDEAARAFRPRSAEGTEREDADDVTPADPPPPGR